MHERIRLGLPIPFALSEDNKCTFLLKNEDAQHFAFSKYEFNKMELPYFTISLVKKGLLCHAKCRKSRKCILLVTKNKENDIFYYTVVSNN